MGLILLIIVLVLLFGGGGGYYAHRNYGYGGLGSVLGVLLIVVVFLVLMGGVHAQSLAASESPNEFNNAAASVHAARSAKVPQTNATAATAAPSSGTPCTDFINLLPLGCTPTNGGTPSIFSGPLQDAITFFSSDFSGAAALAVQIPALQDGNGQACWQQAESVSALLKLHPLPATFKLATDFEALRLLNMSLNNLCKNTACTQVFTDLSNGVSQLGLNVSVPSLSSLCTKFPTIVQAPAVPITPVVTTPASVTPATP